ncbi:MAG: tRNA-dihydrouridine synthase family protein [Desulfosarcinaceae bacterium]|nr:tRNA-dihydrouridine synthase family protein [Desulfosarcinaceae bacterium]
MSGEMLSDLSRRLQRPLLIRGRRLANRLVLSPMAQLGHVAYRQLLDGFGGCGLMFSEMCSARRVPTETPSRSTYFRWRDAERKRLVIQIVGADPDEMAAAAVRIAAEGLFGVDLNFGCSVAAICKRKCGAALLASPDRAEAIVRAVRQAMDLPLFVKFRTGWKDDPELPVELARRFAAAGADALTFHPRVAPDRRNRPAKWAYIRLVKAAVEIPVFGNGDVFSAADCLRMLETTGCDGVAVGRMAITQPWLFAHWVLKAVPPAQVYAETPLAMARLLNHHFEPASALRRYKKFLSYYAANFRFGHTLYSKTANVPSMAAAIAAVERFFAAPPERLAQPSIVRFA